MSIICRKCGHDNPDGTRFCVECGEYLAWDRSPEPEESRQPQPEEPRPPEQHAELAAELSERTVTAAPGKRTATMLVVRNRGTRIERVGIELDGDASGYASVEPDELVIQPGEAATCTITFAPPRSASVPAGEARFSVRAASQVNRGVYAFTEGGCVVGEFDDLRIELRPKVSRGRWTTRHSIVLTSQGNRVRRVLLSATADEEPLRLTLPEARPLVAPGRTVVPLRVSARPAFTGEAREIPFSVAGGFEGGSETLRAEGARVARPLFAPWALKGLAGLAVLSLVFVAVLVAVRRPPPVPPPGTHEAYLAGSGTISGGFADVAVAGLTEAAKVFVTPDLSRITWANATMGQPRTRDRRPAGTLGVTNRGQGFFRVQPIDGGQVDGMDFGYLVATQPSGTVEGLQYESGSGSLQPGENRVDVPASTATSGSVVLLTVELPGPADTPITGLKVDAKNDGAFTVATLDLTPAPSVIGFSWLVVDSADPDRAGTNTTTAVTETGDPVRIDSPLADGSSVVLLTTDAAPRELAGVAMPGVCVGSEGDGSFTVEWYSDRITSLPTDFDYLVARRTWRP
ncbi:zinc-ribbon domain-containing protein [Nonomuraea longicatena]|uniref:Zinc ribbon domain-containing protein n=1 Tax=Nonomuraea longicatena TaxID=83682 RepID=A0ABN1NUA3_9ACTN